MIMTAADPQEAQSNGPANLGDQFRRADDPQSAPRYSTPYIKKLRLWICPSEQGERRRSQVGERNTYLYATEY
jgi:hypothetical protein